MNIAFNVDDEGALKADTGLGISQSDTYVGNIRRFVFMATDNKARYVSIDFESDSGEKAKYMRIYYANKNGTDNFARKKIDALLSILGIKQATYSERDHEGKKEYYCPDVEGSRIAISLQKEEFYGDKEVNGVTTQVVKYKMNYMHSFYPDTMKTFSEKALGKEANVYKRKYKDILVSEDSNTGPVNSGPVNSGATGMDDDLPF